MSDRTELRALTSARGIAAWWVVLYHLRGALQGVPAPIGAVLEKGYLAVDFFFLLSGFVLALRYGEPLRAGGLAAVPAFLRRRIARVWPLHAVMLGLALVLVGILQASGRSTREFSLAALPSHLLLVQAWGFADPLCWNDPAWSISCEAAAYLLFPLWVMVIDWRRQRTATLCAAIGALLALLYAGFAARGATYIGEDIAHLGVLRCLLEFATGTLLHALWVRQRGSAMRALSLAAALSLGIAWSAGLAETAAVPAMLAALLLAMAITTSLPDKLPAASLLHWLGTISYATYISHYLLWFAFKLAFVQAGTVGWPLVGSYMLLVLAASVALHRWVERPAQRWINRLGFRPGRSPLPASRSPRG